MCRSVRLANWADHTKTRLAVHDILFIIVRACLVFEPQKCDFTLTSIRHGRVSSRPKGLEAVVTVEVLHGSTRVPSEKLLAVASQQADNLNVKTRVYESRQC